MEIIFIETLKLAGCDIALRQSYGHVVSPGNLKIPYPHNVKCTFTVELPEGLEDQVEFYVMLRGNFSNGYVEVNAIG